MPSLSYLDYSITVKSTFKISAEYNKFENPKLRRKLILLCRN
jgi:hypothetical protein